MRKTVLLLASTMLTVLVASGVAGALTSGAVLDANAPNHDSYSDTASIPSSDQKIVQTFVAQNTGYLTDVKVRAQLNTQYSGEMIVQIISIPEPNGPTEVLSETRVGAPTRSSYTSRMMSATFASPAHVVAGQTYGLALDTLPEQSGGWILSSAGYSEGKLRGLQGNSTWTDFSGSIDGVFSIYVVPDTTTSVPDTTPPVVAITDGPSEGETIKTNTVTFRFSANEPGVTFECFLGVAGMGGPAWGGVQECNSGQIAYSDLVDSAHNFDGEPNDGKVGNDYAFAVRATDAEGNVVDWNDVA